VNAFNIPSSAAVGLVDVPGAYEIDREGLAALLADEPRYRADQVWRGLWERGARPADMTDLPKSLRDRLEVLLSPALQEVARSVSSDGQTTKWLWQLEGGARIESVLMRYQDRSTVCISSQSGCAMGCSFCATGQMGFGRHLSMAEIVEQVVSARREALPRRLGNVVFMGMGEPLANYARVWAAVERIHAGLGISARHITVSTVGLAPGIRRLAREPLPVNLAVSLHAARDELRDRLVPLNRRYPLAVLGEACAEYLASKSRRLSLEWALIDGTNDTARDAAELARFARPLGAHVNLIPLNSTSGYSGRGTPPTGVVAFRDHLVSLGVNATVRLNRGTDIDAACGQLAARNRAAPAVVPN
jgi:23S rRNA (adenine2503-C2)-methyltransferase